MQLHEASPIAAQVYRQLMPLCTTIIIAGSIRRCKPEVKDIEIVALPRVEELVSYDLFNQPSITRVIDARWSYTVLALGKRLLGLPHGRQMKIELPQGINLDLFLPQPEDYYRQLSIRTGSAEYSRYAIAGAWVRQGWVGTDDGLRLKSQCKETPSGWKCQVPRPTLPPHWQSEPEFFEWLKVPYKDPRDREM